ncbi:SDR family oxidoreductase [Ralstonia insidiosa]|jgi:citronellol/citronellal dehydrogenase|uniref:SDR family oxidoreductase n=1 Tax=Ralstonia TaxID=48736 RepID=UPI000664A657|nr:SDR family oxidoreductase [Ralstonia insidiosa]KMW47247.1 2,4-dienoyl-CoA reductase [Ralstonia sp. MD27]MBX3774892.1 SDR family oxidoreductase [Ralstonia pickettii]NOZ19063.1 SDR family oxidoreductase [Betaproteobacteria bacterium]MBA9858220.1 SDR family oxidoreductase [Ralstonia insidiosa]MBA9873044.1 SDR family oxidoreductase [Ralstonia insidiosa]
MYRSVFRPGLFLGQVAVVTGGGSGIGRCTAHELASLGAAVALVGRNADKLAAVRTEIVEAGGTAHAYVCNIRDEAAVQATIAQILGEHGRIDALVNNAGGQFPSPLKDISVKGWEAVVQTNLTGGFLMARECLNQAMQQRGGAIVNIVADMWGGMPNMGHSGAARAGMINFTETAAFEWAQYGVRVNAVAPGYVASSGMDAYPPWMAETIRSMPRTVPAGRFATEAEVSSAIVYLLSEAAAFITGTTLRVDGGRPNVRPGTPMQAPRHGAAPFNGFHLAATPKVLQDKETDDAGA